MLSAAGVTSIDISIASVTVKLVLPLTAPLVADTVVLPTPAVVAKPFEPAALLTVATALSEDVQVTCVVRSCVELSLYLSLIHISEPTRQAETSYAVFCL